MPTTAPTIPTAMVLGLPLRRQPPRRLRGLRNWQPILCMMGGKSKVSGLKKKRSPGAEKNKTGVGKNRLKVQKRGGGVWRVE